MIETRRVAVIGGGISGLTLAYELNERAERLPGSLEVLCFEKSSRAGGNLQTTQDGGYLCEWGPNGILDDSPATMTLISRLGLESERLPANAEARRRYLYRNGKLHELFLEPKKMLRSPVLSLTGKLRAVGERWVSKRSLDGATDDETVYDFARRRLGREAAETLIDAMVSGIWAGDTQKLSAAAAFPKMVQMEQEHGGLIRAMMARRGSGKKRPHATLNSFKGGMRTLPEALAAAIGPQLTLNRAVRSISDLGDRGFRILFESGTPADVDAVVLATAAPVSATLLEEMDAPLANFLRRIPYAPIVVAHLGFVEDSVAGGARGFGFLAPRNQGLRILGTLWPSDVFPDRAPKGLRLTTTMLGGAHDPEAVQMTDEGIIRLVREELRKVSGTVVAPRFTRVERHRLGIPQYTLGHLDRVAEIDAAAAEHGGLYLCGNALRGVSVNHCIAQAGPLAETIFERLAAKR
jgi:oxygen-dependent protoporphyrinogen oxidase